MKYRIAYIDEEDTWINTFYSNYKNDFDIIRIKIENDSKLEEVIKIIFNAECQGVVTDYLFDENVNVNFNGDSVFNELHSLRPKFPVIVLTSFEPQAVQTIKDAIFINSKDYLDGDEVGKSDVLKMKIISGIESYISLTEGNRRKIEELVKKRNEGLLEPLEEEELTKLFIQLDELEPEGKDIPANLLTTESITKLNEFVNQTKEILNELKKKK